MCSQFDKKISEETKDASQSDASSCDPIRLGEAVDRFQRKLVFSSNFILSRKNLKVMLGLQRSSDSLNGASLLDNSYNLSKVCHFNLLKDSNDLILFRFKMPLKTFGFKSWKETTGQCYHFMQNRLVIHSTPSFSISLLNFITVTVSCIKM